ncbi:hypothetical protein DXG03_007326 [Asterophora parasitica]|uniref:Shieldin complex subunit 2 first OB fold domain-containing protein n=1 Tax=Asterophora parasitica TaxID=117018 RepID=A0A9P7KEL4_9AGAR|nr:hypothetical protein DXG03_007326 [Asterophora parasitica]
MVEKAIYRIFLGAPTAADIDKDANLYHWRTISSKQVKRPLSATQSLILPAATLEAASRRISLIYKNVIFDDGAEEEELDEGDESRNGSHERTTFITWAPTADESALARRTDDIGAPSFLMDISKSQMETQFETQETQSYNYSDASSIARFPQFHFSLNSLTSLASLVKLSVKGSRKVNVLLAALEVEGPDTIRLKKGAEAGKEVSLLALILGDEEGAVCKLTAWREVADAWAEAGVKRGDVLLIENVIATWDAATTPTLTASPHNKSKAEICYRTMPYTHEDNRLRPDLRLGESDAAVRKVAAVARWFEDMAGLGGH